MPKKASKSELKKIETFIDNRVKSKVDVFELSGIPWDVIAGVRPFHMDEIQWQDGCRWVIHTIVEGVRLKRFKNGDEMENYVTVSSKALKDILSNDYVRYVNALLDADIIECDGKYSSTLHESLGYRIAEQYQDSKIQFRTIRCQHIKEAVRRQRKKQAAELKKRNPGLSHITKWLTEPNLKMDTVGVETFMNKCYDRMIKEIGKAEISKKTQEKTTRSIHYRRGIAHTQLTNWKINKGFSIDSSAGRLYSPLSNIPSITRNFITTAHGETLVSTDVKNSQPFHMLGVLKKGFWKKEAKGITLWELDRELYSHLETEFGTKDGYIMFPGTLKSVDKQHFRKESFKELVLTGKLYEFISERFKGIFVTKGGFDRFASRNLAKRQFLQLMYFDPKKRSPKMKAIFEEFRKLFPLEAGIMELLKSRRYTDFPILLQKLEVRMLLQYAAGAIHNFNPEIPLYSIHDSLVTTETHRATVKGIVEETYRKRMGVIPTLEITEWSEATAYAEFREYVESKVQSLGIDLHKDLSPFMRWLMSNKTYKFKKLCYPGLPILYVTYPDVSKINVSTGVRRHKVSK